MEITARIVKQIKKAGHHLKPIVRVGKSNLTTDVLETIDKELFNHELIKIKLLNNSDTEIEEITRKIEDDFHAKIIRSVGNTILVYRQNPNPDDQKIFFE